MGPKPNDFIEVVARARDLAVTASSDHFFRLDPRDSAVAWHCDLDDGTPSGDIIPAPYVRWVCPALRVTRAMPGMVAAQLEVRHTGPKSDLGRLVARLRGRSESAFGGGAEDRLAYNDPSGIIDGPLRQRIEHWPEAPHGDGVVRPATLWAIRVTGEGLIVESVSWWGSAPALDHHLELAIDIADRMLSRQNR